MTSVLNPYNPMEQDAPLVAKSSKDTFTIKRSTVYKILTSVAIVAAVFFLARSFSSAGEQPILDSETGPSHDLALAPKTHMWGTSCKTTGTLLPLNGQN